MKYHTAYAPLVSVPMLILPSVVYVALATVGSRYSTSAKPGEKAAAKKPSSPAITAAMRLYNVAQIAVCLYMTVGLFPVIGWPNVFGIDSDFTAAGEWFMLVHYLSKWLDWCDTLFIILKGNSLKQLSFLHVYHHSTIGVVWGILLRAGAANGTARYGAWINSVTHVLMYSHYLWTSFGFRNPFKAYLTMWQIGQFYSCFLHAILVLSGLFVVETKLPIEFAWLQFCYHITMIYLFTFQMAWVPQLYWPLDANFDDAATTKKKAK